MQRWVNGGCMWEYNNGIGIGVYVFLIVCLKLAERFGGDGDGAQRLWMALPGPRSYVGDCFDWKEADRFCGGDGTPRSWVVRVVDMVPRCEAVRVLGTRSGTVDRESDAANSEVRWHKANRIFVCKETRRGWRWFRRLCYQLDGGSGRWSRIHGVKQRLLQLSIFTILDVFVARVFVILIDLFPL